METLGRQILADRQGGRPAGGVGWSEGEGCCSKLVLCRDDRSYWGGLLLLQPARRALYPGTIPGVLVYLP